MKIFRKDNIKQAIIMNLIVVAVFACITIAISNYQYINYIKNINNFVITIIDNVNKQYPNINQSEIVGILNNDNEIVFDGNLYSKYNIDINSIPIIKNLESIKQTTIIHNISILALFVLTVFAIYIHYSLKKDNKLQEIASYIREINNKNYSLNIEDNSEGELAMLRNELYKMTIMLKEQAENSLKDKEKLTVWVQDISHQLKTPLTSISIMLDNLKENKNMRPELRHEFITEISKQIEITNFLVLALLKLSKFDAGVVKLNSETIYVHKLANNVIQNLSVLLDIRNVQVEFKNVNEDVYFVGDYKWQLEALTNIIKNCIEHTPENKKIYISYSQNNFYTKISIQDEGTGIEKEDLKHIFERFYKGKQSGENSVGIGLALAKTIIENGNGYISVDSELGKGTNFEIKYMRG